MEVGEKMMSLDKQDKQQIKSLSKKLNIDEKTLEEFVKYIYVEKDLKMSRKSDRHFLVGLLLGYTRGKEFLSKM